MAPTTTTVSKTDAFVTKTERLLTDVWLNEPISFKKLRAGFPSGNGGSGGQLLANWQTLEGLLIGLSPDILYRFMQMADLEAEYSLADLKNTCLYILFGYGTVNHFAGLEYAGLEGFTALSIEYEQAVYDSAATRSDFRKSTEAFWRYMVRLHRWTHMFFPWDLGDAFPQRQPEPVNKMVFDVLPPHPNMPRIAGHADHQVYNYTAGVRPVTNGPKPADTLTDPKWQSFVNKVDGRLSEIWVNEPWETQKIALGLINGGSGSGAQWFSDIVHALIYLNLSGPVVIFGVSKAVDAGSLTVGVAKKVIKLILHDTFNAFEFLGDTGFETIANLSELYWVALDDAATGKDELLAINHSLLTYINRTLFWANTVYPWNLGGRFKRRSAADIVIDYNLLSFNN